VDARNELDAVAYQVERRLGELGDAAPSHERARADMLVSDAREAVKQEAPLDRVRSLSSELQQVLASLASHQAGAGPAAQDQAGTGSSADSSGGSDDDVIDAEFDKS
jgi:molecular chaperone DnaK